jgi:flagellar basal-body rod modification protein FlgD
MPDISSSSFLNSVQVPQTATTGAAKAGQTFATAVAPGQASQLGKQDFLKLLMAQMQNQDPTKPMDDSQTIAQMAQFSALEATQQLSQVVQQSTNMQALFQAGALIGKYVQYDSAADGSTETSSGAVTGVKFTTTDGAVVPTVQVDGKDVDYSTIHQVSSTPISQP